MYSPRGGWKEQRQPKEVDDLIPFAHTVKIEKQDHYEELEE